MGKVSRWYFTSAMWVLNFLGMSVEALATMTAAQSNVVTAISSSGAKVCYGSSPLSKLKSTTRTVSIAGSTTSPTLIVPATSGDTLIKGGIFTVNGKNLVIKGFEFRDVIIKVSGENVRFTENRIINTRSSTGQYLIQLASSAKRVRFDRNEIDAGPQSCHGIFLIKVRDGETNPKYHRFDSNFITGGNSPSGADDCGITFYGGEVNKSKTALARMHFYKNLMENLNHKNSVYLKSSENLMERNHILNSYARIVNRHGQRNIYINNNVDSSLGMNILDNDGYVAQNRFRNQKRIIISAGDSEFGSSTRLVKANGANHPVAVRTSFIRNQIIGDTFRIGDYQFTMKASKICPKSLLISGNTTNGKLYSGCTASQTSTNSSHIADVDYLSKAQVLTSVDEFCQ